MKTFEQVLDELLKYVQENLMDFVDSYAGHEGLDMPYIDKNMEDNWKKYITTKVIEWFKQYNGMYINCSGQYAVYQILCRLKGEED